MPSGTTIGVWIGDDEDLIDRFDQEFGTSDPNWSRSQEVKHAMRTHLAIEDTLQSADWDFDSERSKRHWLRRAVRNEIAREDAME